jgi:hypothetical protein
MSDKLCVCGLSNATVGSVVLHADHLAAMAAASAYDEAAERKAAFEACPLGIDWGSFWQGWKACAKARAKAGGE